MKIEKFTQKAQEAIMESQDIAISMGHQAIDTEHLPFSLRLIFILPPGFVLRRSFL